MKKTRWRLAGAAAGACLYAFALPAFADDTTAPKSSTSTSNEKDAAVKSVPTWEGFEAGSADTLEETFFRLSRDFVVTSDDGFRSLGSVPIWPRGELKFGGFRILPYLREAVEWDDNYYAQANTGPYSSENGRKPQWTHVNEIGALADTQLMGGRLTLAGSAVSIWNIRYNEAQDTWDFDGQFGATYRWPSSAWASIGVAYTRRHDPTDVPGLADDFGRADTRTFFHVGVDKDIFFGSKFRFEIGVDTQNEVATDPGFEDLNRGETTAYLKASYPFLKDTTRVYGQVRYRFDNRQSDRLNDGQTFGMDFGIEGSIPLAGGQTRGLRGQISIGFDSSIYSNDEVQVGSATLIADENREATHLRLLAALQYLISPRSSADLQYLHQTEFSFYGNYQVVDRFDLTFLHNFSRKLTGSVAVFFEHTDPSGQVPNETIPGNPYSANAGNMTREGAGVGLRYAFNDWMDFDFSANVDNRNDHVEKSYRNYTGILGITIYLNALAPKSRPAVSVH